MHWRYRFRKQQLLDECEVPPEIFQGGIKRLAEFARPFAECLVRRTYKSAAAGYARAKGLSRGTRNEYTSTIRKWERWGGGGAIEQLRRKDVREFLDWVHEQAVQD